MSGNYQRKDEFYKRAKQLGFRSRASFKLLELDKRYKLFRQGMKVLDLGCWPGGWLQVAAQCVGGRGCVVGVDLEEIAKFRDSELPNDSCSPICIVGDITDVRIQEQLLSLVPNGYDVLLSDMSPKLSGIRFADVARSAELVEASLQLSRRFLRPGGSIVSKIFPGHETEEIVRNYRTCFEKFSRANLDASRKTSTEMYLVGQKFVS